MLLMFDRILMHLRALNVCKEAQSVALGLIGSEAHSIFVQETNPAVHSRDRQTDKLVLQS
jgi:hypothetical protein